MVVEVKCDGHPDPGIEGEQVLHTVHVGLVIVLDGQALAAVLAEPREVPAGQAQQGLSRTHPAGHADDRPYRALDGNLSASADQLCEGHISLRHL